jgi:TM2 domain-containing membrane protein YozV
MGNVDTMSSPKVRVGNAEREAAVRELGEAYAAGRLDAQEYEERTTAAYAARTVEDLAPLFADLPRDQATVAVPPAAAPYAPAQYDPAAPYGHDPVTGRPYSDRNKVVASLLQLFLPFGVGRFYSGHTGIAVAQLLLTPVFIGVIWSFIDGILMLAGRPTDREGRPLRP